MYGVAHGSGPGISILGPRTTQVRALNDLGVYGIFLGDDLPMVFLGLFFGVQLLGDKWLHWELGTFWINAHARNAVTWITANSRTALLLLPGMQHCSEFLASAETLILI
jgi:hypothetical protein